MNVSKLLVFSIKHVLFLINHEHSGYLMINQHYSYNKI
jgi:hypothetical protein